MQAIMMKCANIEDQRDKIDKLLKLGAQMKSGAPGGLEKDVVTEFTNHAWKKQN